MRGYVTCRIVEIGHCVQQRYILTVEISQFWAMKRVIVFAFIIVYPTLAQEEVLKQKLQEFRKNELQKFVKISQDHIKTKRSACDDGKGNYGINSFNFLAFILLTFNVVANVNNNLNNNNNNKNDQNINAISQNSNNVATNTNSGNVIGVTVLPIPGKRSLDFWKSVTKVMCNSFYKSVCSQGLLLRIPSNMYTAICKSLHTPSTYTVIKVAIFDFSVFRYSK